MDLTAVDELASLAQAVATLDDAARGIAQQWLIVGATARDLILHHGHGMPIRRATVDLDVAVAVDSWSSFQSLSRALIARGARPVKEIAHRFELGGWKIDILPFGGIARSGEITWPPDGSPTMSVMGFEEASQHAIVATLPGGVTAAVASPPALLILKLIAWEDRHVELPRHDAIDIDILIASYAASWNEDRLYAEADDLLQRFGYDNSRAAAALLGRDAAEIAQPATVDRVASILVRETSGDTLRLATDMGGRAATNLELLEAVWIGFQQDGALSRLSEDARLPC